MLLIPAIDLKDGQVVHAKGGQRAGYAPIESKLSRSSEPAAVVDGLLCLHPFTSLYVADLDAIEGVGNHDASLADLQARFPALRLWVDKGLCRAEACRSWLSASRGDLVLGSESQEDPELLVRLVHDFGSDRIVLSLDFRGDAFLGPSALLERSETWPARVLVMTLARVGGSLGPDTDRLKSLRRRARSRQRAWNSSRST